MIVVNRKMAHSSELNHVDTTTPSRIISRKEEQEKLEKAMQRLNPEYREVILLAKLKVFHMGK